MGKVKQFKELTAKVESTLKEAGVSGNWLTIMMALTQVTNKLIDKLDEKENDINLLRAFIQAKHPEEGYLLYDETTQKELVKAKAKENDDRRSKIVKEVATEFRPIWIQEIEDRGVEGTKAKEYLDKALVDKASVYNKEIAEEVKFRLQKENPIPNNEKNEIKILESIIKETTCEKAKKQVSKIVEFKKTASAKGIDFAMKKETISSKGARKLLNSRENMDKNISEEGEAVNSMAGLFNDFTKKFFKKMDKRGFPQPNQPKAQSRVSEVIHDGKKIKTTDDKSVAKDHSLHHYCKYHRYNNDHHTKECSKFSAFVDDLKRQKKWVEPKYDEKKPFPPKKEFKNMRQQAETPNEPSN